MTEKGITPQELVAQLGGVVRGADDSPLTGVGTLAGAGPDALTFLANPHYRGELPGTRAGCVVLRADDADSCPVTAIVAEDPYAYYARAAALIAPRAAVRPGVHPDATVSANAEIAAEAWVGPRAVIGDGAVVAAGACIGAGCVIGDGVRIGAGTRLVANVTVIAGARLGRR